jgi:ATP-dependent protease HslVU (ClpYQ) peptidase subunit
MTTIACVGGIVAADTQLTANYISYGSKIIEDGEKIYCLVGEVCYARVLVQLLQDGMNLTECRAALKDAGIEYKEGQFAVVVIDRDELDAILIHPNLLADTLSEPWAVGSGGDFAMGAIYAGSSAEEAVAIAIELDPSTGGEVETIEI